MKTKFLLAEILFLLALLAPPVRAAEVIDRIVATVNGRIILQSDWDEAVRYEALAGQRALSQITADDRRATLDRLIDQELLRGQMPPSGFPHASPAEVEKRVHEIRQQHPGAESEPGWRALLEGYGLTEKDLAGRVALQLDLARLVETRLRSSIQIDPRSIESYYREKFVPQLRESGGSEVPLAEVMPRIKELLTQQKINELLAVWLESLRAESEIRTRTAPPPSSSGGQSQ